MGSYTADTKLKTNLWFTFGFTSGFVPRLTTRVSVERFHFSPNTCDQPSVFGISFTSVGVLEPGSSFLGSTGRLKQTLLTWNLRAKVMSLGLWLSVSPLQQLNSIPGSRPCKNYLGHTWRLRGTLLCCLLLSASRRSLHTLVSLWIRIYVEYIGKQQFRRLGPRATRIEVTVCLLELLQLEGTFPQCRRTRHVDFVEIGIEYE